MFIDTAKINIKAGNGGNGSVSFHREKYVAAADAAATWCSWPIPICPR